jgi:uncharacterized protein
VSLPPLIGRSGELSQLDQLRNHAHRGAAQLVVMFGRRRVGKTFLLRHFAATPPRAGRTVYFAATREGSAEQRRQLADELRHNHVPVADGDDIGWTRLLGSVVESARHEQLTLLIDEAPYLIAADPSWATVVQRLWDAEQARADQSKLLLVLNGSAISTMSSMISSRGALFGRPTSVIRIDPFSLPMSHEFLGRPPAEASIEAHAACGGYPLLLQRWDLEADAETNLIRLAGEPFGPLAANANSLLLDVADSGGHHTVLGAIGRGANKLSEISNRAGKRAEHSIDVLMHAGFVGRRTPIGEPARKNVHYVLTDSYLQLWYTIVDRNLQLIESGQGPMVIRRSMPLWTRFLAEAFEREARAHAARLAARGDLGEMLIGEWWTDTVEQAQVDVVGVDAGRWVLAGEVKWADRFGRGDLEQLERSIRRAGRGDDLPLLASWSRNGPAPDVRALRPAMLQFTTADLVAPE